MNPNEALAAAAQACGDALPLPPAGEGPVFAQPWQAHAFAMTVQLHQRGVFTWPQWAQALSEQIRTARERGEADDGSTYYVHWLNALEQIVIDQGLGTPERIHALEHAWEAAAERTPHGQPIVLQADDEAGPA